VPVRKTQSSQPWLRERGPETGDRQRPPRGDWAHDLKGRLKSVRRTRSGTFSISAIPRSNQKPKRNAYRKSPARGKIPLPRRAIDLCPEYTGNAAFFFHEDGDPVWKDAVAGYVRAAKLDYERNRLVWLTPAPANNSWVIAVRESLARMQNLRTMADFARFVRDGNNVKLAALAEFVESAAGLPAFEAVYGFRSAARQLLVLSGGETSATMKAAATALKCFIYIYVAPRRYYD
jgi:hypothetical protein